MVRILVAVVLALALPLAASAAAVVESVKGTARAGQAALTQGMRFVAPTSVATAAGSQVTLKFDDGMQIVLDENSLLRVLHFRHAEKDVPDGAVFELLSGAARVVTARTIPGASSSACRRRSSRWNARRIFRWCSSTPLILPCTPGP